MEHFNDIGQIIQYEYDFGDGWSYEILFEGILLKTKGASWLFERSLAQNRHLNIDNVIVIQKIYRSETL